MLIRSLAVFCCVSLSACAGQPKSARESDRTSEADRALSFVRAKQPALDDCYAREYLVGSPLGATYDFELVVPPAAIAHRVKIVGRSNAEKLQLEMCLTEVLRSVQFPARPDSHGLALKLHIKGGDLANPNEPIAMLESR